MDFLSHPLIAIALLIGLLVFVHEAGHFIVGKMCGIAVEVFSIGFGPVILSWKRGETSYRLSLMPLGGFVKFYGALPSEEVPEEIKGREFFRAPVSRRIATVAAGPLANFLLAIVSFTGMGWHGIPVPPPVVGEIMAGSPAEKAGLQFMDRVKSVNGVVIETWRDIQTHITSAAGRSLHLKIERNGQIIPIDIVPAEVIETDIPGQKTRGQIGISPGYIPAVVTITDPAGLAAQAGIRTGDLIVSVQAAGQEIIPVKYWRNLEPALKKIMVQNNSTVVIWTVKHVGNPLTNTDFGAEHTLTMPLQGGIDGVKPDFGIENLGISHAQLTIFSAEEPVKNLLYQGDQIIQWGETPVGDAFQFHDSMISHQAPSMDIRIRRNGSVLPLKVPLKAIEVQKAAGKETMYTLPVVFWGGMESPEPIVEQYRNPLNALAYGIKETGVKTVMIASMVAGLFTGDMPLGALGGPIAVAKVASDSVKMGWLTFVGSLAMISINLGLLNLFPIPVLDGGQLVLLITEGLRRRPLPEAVTENYQKIGFVMILAVLVLATYNDLSRFWTSMLKGVSGFFHE